MIAIFAAFFALFSIQAQTTYYVASTGSDTTSCGTTAAPCASINQVLTNYPGASYTVSIAGAPTPYATTAIKLQSSAVVIFQGTGNPTITTSWGSGSFITNTATSGFEFHDLTLTLSGNGDNFASIDSATNVAGFYNVVLTYSGYTYGDFVDVNGGALTISNVTLSGASFDSYFILDFSDGETTNITITGSTFTNLNIGQDGGFLVFDAFGAANIVLDSTTFTGISTDYVFIGFWAEDSNQKVTITNNVFNNTYTYLPNIYVENDYQCVIYVANSSWNNATAGFVSGALETLGSDDGVDHNITLDNLTFTNNNGPYGGALLVAFNTLTLSNSNFAGNSAGYGNDLVQGLDSNSASFKYVITNSYSTSALPKAVVWNLSSGTVTDISDQLPNPSASVETIRVPLTRAELSAAPKFGRKIRKD